jgi:hypothetical protein
MLDNYSTSTPREYQRDREISLCDAAGQPQLKDRAQTYCSDQVKYCQGCNAPVCRHHVTDMGICAVCVANLIAAIICDSCHIGNIDGRCFCPAPVTALLDWVDGDVLLAHESLVCDLFGPLGVM